uniref:Ubiquitin-like protease family profile domain-containing protein n=1 Tax=Oryza punctata TaxID=4537 RepID=A0A0E0LVI0_ORYPU
MAAISAMNSGTELLDLNANPDNVEIWLDQTVLEVKARSRPRTFSAVLFAKASSSGASTASKARVSQCFQRIFRHFTYALKWREFPGFFFLPNTLKDQHQVQVTTMPPVQKSRAGKEPIDILSDSSDDVDVVEDMKKKLLCNSSYDVQLNNVKRQKVRSNKEPSFTRFSLSDYQKSIVKKYEFDSLLLFDSNFVPVKFATWIANKVDVRTSKIILKDKIIPVTKESIHAVLGLPLGGLEFGTDFESGRQSVLSMFGQLSLPSVKFFGDQLIQKKELSEDQTITSFLIVALACFLCPNSSLIPSIKYLTIFEDVVYLDFVDFGSRNVDQGHPRISVWKHDMISTFSKLDEVDENNFGLRPIKDFQSTCYFQPEPTHCRSNSIRDRLDLAVGTMVPDFLKDKISEMFTAHCCTHHIVDIKVIMYKIRMKIVLFLLRFAIKLAIVILNLQVQKKGNMSMVQLADANHVVSHHSEESNVIIDACATPNAPSYLRDQQFVTPDVANLKNMNNFVNQGPYVVALNLVKTVANKFRPRFASFNSRSAIIDHDMPSFRLLDSDDDTSDFDQANEAPVDATPSSHHCISFHSVEDTPDYMISGNRSVGTTKKSNSQNLNKRIFQDLTNSPDVQLLGESNFNDRCKKLCSKTDELYNASNNVSKSTQDFSSGGKLPLHGPRRVVIPARHATNSFVTEKLRFPITDEENRYFIVVCRLSESSQWQSYDAVNIDNIKAKFYSFGQSLKKGGSVSHYVMAVFCRVLFHNNHPSKSKKNYFFPSIGDQLIADLSIPALEKVNNSFSGASRARKLHLCDMFFLSCTFIYFSCFLRLFFPIYYNEHWFLFIIDIKDRMLVFLDTLHNEGHEYFEPIMSLLIDNLQTVWDKFVCTPINFRSFEIVFPPVPRQENSCDSGVYVMKFMELWSPRIVLSNVLANESIGNIRVQYMNQIFFHPKNQMLQTEIEDVVLNWFDAVSFVISFKTFYVILLLLFHSIFSFPTYFFCRPNFLVPTNQLILQEDRVVLYEC